MTALENPLGLDGFEFVEFTSPDPEAMGGLFSKLGFTHVGKRLGQTGTAFELPAYTTAKLVASWRLSPTLRLSLDVDNLFDTTYYSSSYSRVWVTPGTARNLSLGLQVKL